MAIVKFVVSGCPMNNIFPYVMRDEATEETLIDGVNCSPDTVQEEFQFVKRQFHKEDGRMYYHIVQSFSPDDDLTPETAHEIGLRFAEAFPGYQILVATHVNTAAIHNHLIMNSVSFEDGRKFHQTRDEMLKVKEYSNQLCLEYGLSVTEPKSKGGKRSKAKAELVQTALYAMAVSSCKEEFIQFMEEHGYRVKWEDDHKYITFTTPDNVVIRDKNLFDERLLKDNLEVYFAMGGMESELMQPYQSYRTSPHTETQSMTSTDGLRTLLGDLLTSVRPSRGFMPTVIRELSPWEKARIEAYLGRKLSPQYFPTYSTREEYEQSQGIGM